MLQLLILLITLLYVIMIVDFIRGWRKLEDFIPSVSSGEEKSLKFSIIVPARNESQNIKNLLTDLINQTYPGHLFEIIVADDFSEDDTIEMVRQIQAPNLRIISLREEFGQPASSVSSKKYAISCAVPSALHEWIITTDADCRIEKNWLQTIASFIQMKNPNMVCGPVALIEKEGILNRFQIIDIAAMTGITGACLANRFANMCNGANLAYRKDVYEQVGGYDGNEKQPSGDDMFLMHKIEKKFQGTVHFLKSREAIVRTFPQPDFKSFREQRIRWLSKSAKYTDLWVTLHLVVGYLFNFFMLVAGFIGLFFDMHFLLLFLLMLFIKLALEFPFMYRVMDFLGQASLIIWYVPVQFLHVLYVTVFGIAGIFSSFKWKGRNF